MLHVAVDAVGSKNSGGAMVLLDFLDAACKDSEISKLTVFCSPRSVRNFDLPKSEKIHEYPKPLSERFYVLRVLWYEHFLGLAVTKIGADVLINMSQLGIGSKTVPHITFIQQPKPFTDEWLIREKLLQRIRLMVHKTLIGRSCSRASAIVVQNRVIKEKIRESFKVDKENIEVVTPGPPPLPEVQSTSRKLDRMKACAPGARLLYVGSDSPHKNVGVAVEAIKILRREIPEASLFVTWPSNSPDIQEPGISRLGFLDRDELREAYLNANILILPSLAETVGLPTLEAMSLGIPVLVADRPYAHDICEDAALFFDPLSPEDCAQKALKLLNSKSLREFLVAKGYDLVKRRLASNPYQRMLEIVKNVANGVYKKHNTS